MKKIFSFFLVACLFFPVFNLEAQVIVSNSSITGICYAGNKINRIYIPPPKSFTAKIESKGIGKISVIYSGFSEEPKAAVEYAVNILETILPPNYEMTVKASWTKLSSSGVLGNSSITGFAAGWGIDALEPKAFYPITVAEKIAGKKLNEEYAADIELVLNSSINWYLGTDGNTPTSSYDLVTVVIHELCHGLGFFDSMDAENSLGSYGLGSMPVIYDKFVENLIEERLTDTTVFDQNSKDLYEQLIGGQLYFAGPLTRRYLSGARARLYAPSTWDPGSSISHLDELRTNQKDALMTPFIDYGEAIHDPGILTMSILGDLGWINTRIIPEEIKDTEENLSEVEINAVILSDTTYNRDVVGLVYSFNDFLTSDTLMMSSIASDDYFSVTLPIPSYNTKLDYYFFVADDFSRIYKSPSLAEEKPYSLFIGIDTVKPVISHAPEEYYFERIDSIHFDADVTDNLGIDTVYIEYKVNDGTSKFYGFKSDELNKFSASLAVQNEMLTGGDSLQYCIIAVDKASSHNFSRSPSTGFYSIKIETVLEAVQRYSTDFSDAESDFFFSGLYIAKPSGFSNYGLHSEHPYKSPEEDNKELEFSSVLRHPIIYDAAGLVVTFKELVLVEPGEEGSIFGFSDFYDYVILDASNDYGKTWFYLADGYDSRIISSWENAYNSSIVGQNSTYVGRESMILPHTFFPKISDKISDGDSLLIRFRLFSDPYANGWGWVIEDLQINALVDHVQEILTTEIKVYPNPGNGLINIDYGIDSKVEPALISIYDLAGRCILKEKPYVGEKLIIDISTNPAGLYLIVYNNRRTVKTFRYSLVK